MKLKTTESVVHHLNQLTAKDLKKLSNCLYEVKINWNSLLSYTVQVLIQILLAHDYSQS